MPRMMGGGGFAFGQSRAMKPAQRSMNPMANTNLNAGGKIYPAKPGLAVTAGDIISREGGATLTRFDTGEIHNLMNVQAKRNPNDQRVKRMVKTVTDYFGKRGEAIPQWDGKIS